MKVSRVTSSIQEVVFSVSIIVVAMTGCEASDLRTVRDVDTFIREHIPIGSDRSTVVDVLTKRRIENSALTAKDGIVYAIIRDTSGGPLIKGSISMRFFFDVNGKLARFEVQEGWTGP